MGRLSDRDVAGQERINVWRSETLTALTALGENETRLEGASKNISYDLNRFLSPYLLKAGPFDKVKSRFKRDILDPAIKLHQDIRSSSHQYEMKRITVFDRLSPKEMLGEWELKDADVWQKPRGEKEVGKALYCLHPSISRLRTMGKPPIVIAKPVIVVTSPERERNSNPYGNKDSLLSGTTAPPASIDSSLATSQIISSFDREPSILTDSDSTNNSRSTKDVFNQRRASTNPTTKKQEYLPVAPLRRGSVPLERSDGKHDLPRDSRFDLEEERQSSGRLKVDQDNRPYRRGHSIPGTLNSFPSQAAAHHSLRRVRKDTSGDKSSRRGSGDENSQPPISPSTPVASPPSDKSRSWMQRILLR